VQANSPTSSQRRPKHGSSKSMTFETCQPY
jgi:hypothetical protein